MKNPTSIEGLDLGRLTQRESAFLQKSFYSGNLAPLIAALFLVAILAAAFVDAPRTSPEDFNTLRLWLGVKIVGFAAFGFWAHRWSRLACVLLVAWQIQWNLPLASAGTLNLKLTFWIPVLVFVWGLVVSHARHQLIKKAGQTSQPLSPDS